MEIFTDESQRISRKHLSKMNTSLKEIEDDNIHKNNDVVVFGVSVGNETFEKIDILHKTKVVSKISLC